MEQTIMSAQAARAADLRRVDRRIQRAFALMGQGGRVVLWGGREGDVQAGGPWDRNREAARRLLDRETQSPGTMSRLVRRAHALGLIAHTNLTREPDQATVQLGPMAPPRARPICVTRTTRDALLRAFHGDAS